MKKMISILLCVGLLLALSACSAKNKDETQASKPGDTMSLEKIFETIQSDVEDLPMTQNTTVDADQFETYLFIAPIEGAEALASEAMINAVAHSAVLLRVSDGTDVAAVKAEIEKNANPRKWICTEAEKTIVAAHGNTILLVMSFDDVAEEMVENFNELWS